MLKYLANTPPSIHLLLLVLIPLLRWPAFLAGYAHPDEALSLLVAERAMIEGPLYAGAWYAGPPLHIWLYEGFFWLFGKYALLAIRIAAMLWVYGLAIYLNGIVASFKVYKRFEGAPGVVLAILASVPWSGLHFGAELLALGFLLAAYHRLLRLGEQPSRNYGQMFQLGVLLTLAALADYKAVFWLLGGLVAYVSLRTARLDELFAGLGGTLMVLLALIGGMWLHGNLFAYQEIGLAYYIQRLGATGTDFYPLQTGTTLLSALPTWSILLLLAMIGFVHFRLRFFTYVVNVRSIETVFAIWLSMAMLMLLAKWQRVELADLVFLTPPLGFYVTRVLTFRWPRRLRVLAIISLVGLWGVSYLSGWSLRFPETFAWLAPEQQAVWLYGPTKYRKPLPPVLQQSLDTTDRRAGIWVMDHQPHWYLALDAPCANRYTDFRLAYYKFPVLPGFQEGLANPESEAYVFQAFAQQPPHYILDPHGWFPAMQQRYPSLFDAYEAQRYGDFVVYSRPSRRANPDR